MKQSNGENNRIIIIGASGSIGRQFYYDCQRDNRPAIGTSFRQKLSGCLRFNITTDDITTLIPDLCPTDCVYILAAATNPNWVFSNQQLSREINVSATIRLINTILKQNARVIFLSSTMVFSGTHGHYQENSHVHPTTCYGHQKVEVENHLLKQPNNNWCILRTDAVVTKKLRNNCPVEKTYKTLFKGGAKMASDNFFNLTDVADISCILQKLTSNKFRGIYHATNNQDISRTQLAAWVKTNSIFGEQMSFEEATFSDIPYPEIRPQNSTLANNKLVEEMQIEFASPQNAVMQKVSNIDKYLTSNKPWWV